MRAGALGLVIGFVVVIVLLLLILLQLIPNPVDTGAPKEQQK